MLAQAMFQFEGGHGSLIFDANVPFGPEDHTYVGGTRGTLHSSGPHLGEQNLTLTTVQGKATPQLEGNWFPDGFHGTMAELLCAIEENREPRNSGRENLNSLAFCFAAIAAAHDSVAKVPGEVRSLPKGSVPATMSGSR
jgi:predicted dehydrogenase